MKTPLALVHRIQYDYASEKFKNGVHVFNSVDKDTIDLVISSLLAWAEEKGQISDNTLDLSFLITK